MSAKTCLALVATIFCYGSLYQSASAQGGWRQWKIFLVDGTSVEASPLQLRADGRFSRSMDPKEAGFDRLNIDYLAASTKQLPPVPSGKFKQDLIIMLDGTGTSGAVTFRELKFSEGKIMQNGKEMSLENVAYIKFAHPKRRFRKRRE